MQPLTIEPYRPRLTRSLGTIEYAGWTLKTTAITATHDLPTPDEVGAAASLVRHLPTSGENLALLVVHKGTEALWAILGRWELDILHHRLFRAPLGTTAFLPVPADGPTACVWELAVLDHERRAWVTHVLSCPSDPDYHAYLADALVVEV